MPRTRKLRSSNNVGDAVPYTLDSDEEQPLKSQREPRTRSSFNKDSASSSRKRNNTSKRITRQTSMLEFLTPLRIEDSSDSSDSSIDNEKASKSIGMKCPRPDLKPIKSSIDRKKGTKSSAGRRQTRLSTAKRVRKRQKITSLSSGESESEYESLSTSELDEISSRESEYHSSYTDPEEESDIEESEVHLSDSNDDAPNISSEEVEFSEDPTKEEIHEEIKVDNELLEGVDVKIEDPKIVETIKVVKKKGRKKGENKKILTEAEKFEKEERLKKIEETVNYVISNPEITLSEEAMKPRPRYKKSCYIKTIKEIPQETIESIVEVNDSKYNGESSALHESTLEDKEIVPIEGSKIKKKVKSSIKKLKELKEAKKENDFEIKESVDEKEIKKSRKILQKAQNKKVPEIIITEAPSEGPVVSTPKKVGKRGRPPGSPNKKKKIQEVQKFLNFDYSKITEPPGVIEPIQDEVELDVEEISSAFIQFRKLFKAGTINKQSIKRFRELHESLSHVAREITHEHDSILKLQPNDKCRGHEKLKVKKRQLRAVGDKVSDKFIRKALKGDDDYVLDDIWINTEHTDERHLYHKMTSEGVICQFHEEIRELLAPPTLPKLVEIYKTFRLSDEASQKICEFDYPTNKYEPPEGLVKKVKRVRVTPPETSKDNGTPVPNNEKTSRKILEPVRKSTRRKARGETPDKSMEKRITRSQNNAVKVPAYNEIKKRRKRSVKRCIFFKNGKGKFQRYPTKRRFYKKMDIYSPNFADNYREKNVESIIQVVLNYFATNDIIMDFRQRNFWDFILSDSVQLNSLFNNRLEYIKNTANGKFNEEDYDKMNELLENIQRAIPGAAKERTKRIELDGILRNGLFRMDVINEYQSVYENIASKIALKEYGWKICHFHDEDDKDVSPFTHSVPEKMIINRLILTRGLSNSEKWSRYIDYCKNRKLHSFFEERMDLWSKSGNIAQEEELLQKTTLESLKENEKSMSRREIDDQRKLKDMVWERDYFHTSDPVTRKLFNLKRELHELMYERNRMLDQVFESSIAFMVRDLLEKKLNEEETKLKEKFDATKIEKLEDLDQIPLNKEFVEKHKEDIERINELGKLFNMLGTVPADTQNDYHLMPKNNVGNGGGSSNTQTKKYHISYNCFVKDNEVFLRKLLKKNSITTNNDPSVEQSSELSSDKKKCAKTSRNPIKRKREIKDCEIPSDPQSIKRPSLAGVQKKLELLKKDKDLFLWRNSYKIPDIDTDKRLTRRSLQIYQKTNEPRSDIQQFFIGSPFSSTIIRSNNPNDSLDTQICTQINTHNSAEKVISKLKNSDKDNKITSIVRKKKFIQ
uniref:AAA domain-containing protein n=1 Tax=Parastrongyloides trichosuri TaxID=131310 RepID=A0A0N4Z068_PARTI